MACWTLMDDPELVEFTTRPLWRTWSSRKTPKSARAVPGGRRPSGGHPAGTARVWAPDDLSTWTGA